MSEISFTRSAGKGKGKGSGGKGEHEGKEGYGSKGAGQDARQHEKDEPVRVAPDMEAGASHPRPHRTRKRKEI